MIRLVAFINDSRTLSIQHLLLFIALLRQQNGVNVWQHTTSSDGDFAEQLRQLLRGHRRMSGKLFELKIYYRFDVPRRYGWQAECDVAQCLRGVQR